MPKTFASIIESANEALIANGDVDTIPQFFQPDYRVHLTGGHMQGHQAIRKYFDLLQRAFSDRRVEVEILTESNTRIAWQRTFHATHAGAYQDFPASGRELVWRDMVVSELRDGKIAEEWVVSDLAERLLLARKSK